MIIVKATVVRLRVVYMGTFMTRTDSMVTNFQQKTQACINILEVIAPPARKQHQIHTIYSKYDIARGRV